MALAVTYVPTTHSVYATLFGCPLKVMAEVGRRLSKAKGAVFHPLLLPGIFAELERRRHFELVEAGLIQRVQLMTKLLRNNAYDWKSRGKDEEDTSTTDSVDLWMEVCNLCNALKKWKEQLSIMIACADELSELQANSSLAEHQDGTSSGTRSSLNQDGFQREIRTAGELIKERLLEISMEYNEKIRDCDLMMNGMAMATELVSMRFLRATCYI